MIERYAMDGTHLWQRENLLLELLLVGVSHPRRHRSLHALLLAVDKGVLLLVELAKDGLKPAKCAISQLGEQQWIGKTLLSKSIGEHGLNRVYVCPMLSTILEHRLLARVTNKVKGWSLAISYNIKTKLNGI
jgi:hypothetical protein